MDQEQTVIGLQSGTGGSPGALTQCAPARPERAPVPFGVTEMRLTAGQWLATILIVAAFMLFTPRLWKKVERFDTPADYRIPYTLSKDYWLYQRRAELLADTTKIPVLGDSVIWGEYVLPDGTLSHFLSQESGQPERFVNCGVNGLFPLAMEGLVESYGTALRGRKIIVHCNVLWMSNPKADLRVTKEETFNHSRLVPQFFPSIPCYKADASERLSVVIEKNVAFSAWVGHLQNTYFEQRSIPNWTLMEDSSASAEAPARPNAWKNPLAQIALSVPGEPADDPLRGPRSPRHKPWTDAGASPTHFDWVDLDSALQWQAFQRVVGLLRARGNEVFVILGPFNEHMVAPDQRPTFAALRDGISAWLTRQHIPHVAPETLPSDLYADASHPLTAGYALLAKHISQNEMFRAWLGK